MAERTSSACDTSGILMLDKPIGLTSNGALQTVKRLMPRNKKRYKVGHAGSLDPLATGMLFICCGKATRFSEYLMQLEKHYRVEMTLGARTETGDAEGAIVETHPTDTLTTEQIQSVMQEFLGEITQIPSMYSAVKHQGQPLYKLARQGIVVERKPRKAMIYQLDFLQHDGDKVQFDVRCSKGTYVRTLVEDMGARLGCGAYVSQLRRTGMGRYLEQDMHRLQEVEERVAAEGGEALWPLLCSLATIFEDWPSVALSEAALFYLRRGQPVSVPYSPTEGRVCLLAQDGSFVGIGAVLEDGRVAARRWL